MTETVKGPASYFPSIEKTYGHHHPDHQSSAREAMGKRA